ncbi:hypothetical protein AB6G95_19375 [Proteus vulgaris]|uniref:hypothetical protein n=1 Tax=Proteus vulgaris TaxID=585 RepID=UPI0034DCDBAD
MTNTIRLNYPQHVVSLPMLEAIEVLKSGPFGVFLTFNDPRTGALVQKLFPFFYRPHNTYGLKGRCFVSEWLGLPVYIPSDLSLFIEGQQDLNCQTRFLMQEGGFLSAGDYKNKTFRLEFLTNIRVDTPFDTDFLELLSRSGHGHLATDVPPGRAGRGEAATANCNNESVVS